MTSGAEPRAEGPLSTSLGQCSSPKPSSERGGGTLRQLPRGHRALEAISLVVQEEGYVLRVEGS